MKRVVFHIFWIFGFLYFPFRVSFSEHSPYLKIFLECSEGCSDSGCLRHQRRSGNPAGTVCTMYSYGNQTRCFNHQRRSGNPEGTVCILMETKPDALITERAWNPLGERVPETLENPLGPKRKRKNAWFLLRFY